MTTQFSGYNYVVGTNNGPMGIQEEPLARALIELGEYLEEKAFSEITFRVIPTFKNKVLQFAVPHVLIEFGTEVIKPAVDRWCEDYNRFPIKDCVKPIEDGIVVSVNLSRSESKQVDELWKLKDGTVYPFKHIKDFTFGYSVVYGEDNHVLRHEDIPIPYTIVPSTGTDTVTIPNNVTYIGTLGTQPYTLDSVTSSSINLGDSIIK